MGRVEDAVRDIGAIGLPHVQQDQRLQLDGLTAGPPAWTVVTSLASTWTVCTAPTEGPAVGLEFGIVREHVDPGSGPASVDVVVAADNQSQAVAPGIVLISRCHHDVPCLLNLR
ncbi:hypothetical protein OG840_21925 [Streptomyces sp. NBC_01764]|uniref:hypothetical protein n=1 Tax=Streptomyces sp. NBC_01764 TaxID=2975935 RepID=UPI002257B203|nr:hypothetical protein [Streptomyces sp. NBC_01764]MCX4404286.1 hypothetical protein [Streptomyces sp. NBC_01764]